MALGTYFVSISLLFLTHFGQGQGVGGKVVEVWGIWNSSQVTVAHILLWVWVWGCGGGAMIGVGRVVGRGFNWNFEQNRYHYIEFGYQNAYYKAKSGETAIFGGSPIFGREIPCNDISLADTS